MFGLGPATKIYLAVGATDMRKGFEGLYGLVRDRLKLLVWDGSGLWVCAKRLEKGRFHWPEAVDGQPRIALSHEELALLLGGIDLAQTRRRRWYRNANVVEHKHAERYISSL